MDNLKNNAVVVLREKLQKKYDDYLTEIQDEKKRLKNAKRNAKRKAIAGKRIGYHSSATNQTLYTAQANKDAI